MAPLALKLRWQIHWALGPPSSPPCNRTCPNVHSQRPQPMYGKLLLLLRLVQLCVLRVAM
jgi:hypothetical protein